jgi:hypothetical protein
MDVDDDPPPLPKTSHHEAFATLNSQYFDTMRSRGERSEQLGLGGRMKRLFVGNSSKPKHTQSAGDAGSNSSARGGGTVPNMPYEPSWMTMAPRARQEENERVIRNLNDSFKGVGLLPSEDTRKKSKPKSGSSRQKRALREDNVFKPVPDDALFMLVPLWPKETELAFREDTARPPPIEDRQYLLVYYVKQLQKQSKGGSVSGRDKKDKRDGGTGSGGGSANSSSGAIEDASQLKAFDIAARVVGYQQLQSTGVRCPSFGLSVTGSMELAVRGIPPKDVREREYDPMLIGVWNSREQGMELLPEALEKLGLCEPRGTVDIEEHIPLSALGRAAIEMAWLGGVALTSFPALAGTEYGYGHHFVRE